jgi:hypothetical protein
MIDNGRDLAAVSQAGSNSVDGEVDALHELLLSAGIR